MNIELQNDDPMVLIKRKMFIPHSSILVVDCYQHPAAHSDNSVAQNFAAIHFVGKPAQYIRPERIPADPNNPFAIAAVAVAVDQRP